MGEMMTSRDGDEEARDLRVLLVDDEPSLGVTLGRALGEGYALVCATTVEDALARLEKDRDYDAILCDLNMPGGSGESFYRSIASRWPGIESRVVFITGGIFDDRLQHFLDAVPNRCLEKPFDVATLEQVLHSGPPRITLG
jgi:two-component system, NtrC family, sensor kinase